MPGFPSLSFWICMKHRLVHVQHCPLRGFFSRLSPKNQFGVGIYGSGAAEWPQEPWALLLGRRAIALERHRVSESWGLTRTHLLLSAQLPPSLWQAGEKSYLYLGLRNEIHQLFFLLWWPNMWQEGVYLGLPSSESSLSCLGGTEAEAMKWLVVLHLQSECRGQEVGTVYQTSRPTYPCWFISSNKDLTLKDCPTSAFQNNITR